MNPSIRALGRRQLAVLMTAVLALTGIVIIKAGSARAASEVTYPVACNILGPQSAKLSVDHEPATASAGGLYTLKVKSQMPAISLTLPIKSVKMSIPAPKEVVGIVKAEFTGGNLDGTYSIDGTPAAVLTFTPRPGQEVMSNNIQLPDMAITAAIGPGTAGKTIKWAGPSEIVFDADVTKEICKPAAGAPLLLETPVVGDAPDPGDLGPFAGPNNIKYALNCGIVGEVLTDITTSQTANPVEGGTVAISVKAVVPPVPVSLALKTMTMTIAAPPQLTGIVAAKFIGGNLDGTYEIAPGPSLNIILTPRPGMAVTTQTMQLPEMQFKAAIAPGTGGQTITWGGPTAVGIDVGVLKENCPPKPGQAPLITTVIGSAPVATTTTTTTVPETTTTTTIATTTTTVPETTTTTTIATTTTTVPETTTTTVPETTTTTVPATTTTTVPATTTTTVPATTTTTTTVPETTTTTTLGGTTSTTVKSTTTMKPKPPTSVRPVSRAFIIKLLKLLLLLLMEM